MVLYLVWPFQFYEKIIDFWIDTGILTVFTRLRNRIKCRLHVYMRLDYGYCPFHVPAQPNFRRYISLNQAQTHLDQWKV